MRQSAVTMRHTYTYGVVMNPFPSFCSLGCLFSLIHFVPFRLHTYIIASCFMVVCNDGMHACYLPSLSIKSCSSLLKPKVSAQSISVTTERPLSSTASLVVYRTLLGSKANGVSTTSLDDHGETSRRHTVVDGAITIGFRAQSTIEGHRETSCCKPCISRREKHCAQISPIHSCEPNPVTAPTKEHQQHLLTA
jgi:hypothetical protein